MSSRGNPLKLNACKGKNSPLSKFLQIDCKSGKIDTTEAEFFFKQMLHMRPLPPNSCFVTLLSGLIKSRHSSQAISFYKTMAKSGALGLRSDPIILNVLINCYSRMNLGSAAFSAFGLILKNGYCPSGIAFTSMIKVMFSEKNLDEALSLYSKMVQLGCTPDVFTYTILIDGLCKTGNAAIALRLHRGMVKGKVGIDKESCKLNTMSSDVNAGGCIERLIVDKKGKGVRISPNVVSYSCLIDGLCRSGMEDDAKSLFTEMIDHGVHPNVVTYNILINVLVKKGKLEEAKESLDMMTLLGVSPDNVTYTTILDGYCSIGKMDEAVSLYNDMIYRGVATNNVTTNSLLKGLFHVKKVGDAISLFNNMKKMESGVCRPNKFTYTIMIDGLCKQGHIGEAQELFLEMQSSGIFQDTPVYSSLVDGLCKEGRIAEAQELFLEMLAAGVPPSNTVYNSLIDGLLKGGRVDTAKELFLQMKSRSISPDVFTYNSLINGLYLSGNCEEAKTFWEKMIGDGILPNVVTYNILIKNLCKEGNIEQSVKVVKLMTQRGIHPDLATCNCLIKGLCLKRRMDDAQAVFSLMESCDFKCDIITYNTLIDGYCKAEMFQEAHNLFLEMETKGCSPNLITFKELISGYCNAGMMQEAHTLFLEMESKGCSPDVFIFAALINGFARQKDTARVMELLQKMHGKKILLDSRTQYVLLEYISKMDGDCESWVKSLPDFSSLRNPEESDTK